MSEPHVWIVIDRNQVEVRNSIDTHGYTVYLEEFFSFKDDTEGALEIEVTDK